MLGAVVAQAIAMQFELLYCFALLEDDLISFPLFYLSADFLPDLFLLSCLFGYFLSSLFLLVFFFSTCTSPL